MCEGFGYKCMFKIVCECGLDPGVNSQFFFATQAKAQNPPPKIYIYLHSRCNFQQTLFQDKKYWQSEFV